MRICISSDGAQRLYSVAPPVIVDKGKGNAPDGTKDPAD